MTGIKSKKYVELKRNLEYKMKVGDRILSHIKGRNRKWTVMEESDVI